MDVVKHFGSQLETWQRTPPGGRERETKREREREIAVEVNICKGNGLVKAVERN